MKAGDIVRFKIWQVRPVRRDDCGAWEIRIGLLLKYEKWEKVGEILSDGKIFRVRGEDIEKAGKRDYEGG